MEIEMNVSISGDLEESVQREQTLLDYIQAESKELYEIQKKLLN